MPPPPRKYDAGDRREKAEEMKRLAEMKRQREAAAAGKPVPRATSPSGAKAPAEVKPGPKDPRFEGRAAKDAERKALEAKRRDALLFGVRMKAAEHSRWKQQAEAQEQTVSSRLQDLFGKGPPKKPSREQARRRKG